MAPVTETSGHVPPDTVFENYAHHRFHTEQIIEMNAKRGVYEIDNYTEGCRPRHGMVQYGTMGVRFCIKYLKHTLTPT